MMTNDTFHLQRFVDAQAGVYEDALDELRSGRKRSHWMWFVFPQLAGLGRSEMARRYAMASLEEARAYLAHALLGARLRECCDALLAVNGRTASEIMGAPDDQKLWSSMTLFNIADPTQTAFSDTLRKYFGGVPDPGTMSLIGGDRGSA